jgi:hypothetical protein
MRFAKKKGRAAARRRGEEKINLAKAQSRQHGVVLAEARIHLRRRSKRVPKN